MILFTKQEKIIIQFLIISLAVGLGIGTIRKVYFTPDYTNQIQKEMLVFKHTVEKIADSIKQDNNINPIKMDDNKPTVSVKSLDINTAHKNDLMSLPHVGSVVAERIMRYREDYGKIKNVDELLNIKGIGPKTLEKMKPYIQIK